ncbi:DUF3885 domain-containing protein [Bacillus carboniphilus]|uniref:DUF3885 domain-containing protein n=1 Tax=Bacillus carboniphilus TaxID=86663 RepID=A0ABY9JUS2_9BACI|nr:DUF3885 domain-containing protein [Bacillus carboniphilus]WLR42180.1 DUF3885 domain-containing protein [Bacillus carboniphilus]
MLYGLQHTHIPSVFQHDKVGYEDYWTNRFVLRCLKGDFRYARLLEAICYKDFGFNHRILKSVPKHSCSSYDVYFINLSKKRIFHLYDDRGCDIIATNTGAIRPIYVKFYRWIHEYDREKIDNLFLS